MLLLLLVVVLVLSRLVFRILITVRCRASFRNHEMRNLGITPLCGILIIEIKTEQIRTNAISVLQLENRNWLAADLVWSVNR